MKLLPSYFSSDHREGSNSQDTPLFQMVGDGDSTEDLTLPLVFLFSQEGAVLTSALKENHNVDVLLLPKERQLGHGEEHGDRYYNSPNTLVILKATLHATRRNMQKPI